MTKSTKSTSTNANASAITIPQWRAKLQTAAKAEVSAATKLLSAVVAARGQFDLASKTTEKAVRDAARQAFTKAGNNPNSVKKRVSDCMAILKAAKLPADLPHDLQNAARDLRDIAADRPRTSAKKAADKRAAQQAGSTNRGKRTAAGKAAEKADKAQTATPAERVLASVAHEVDRAEAARVLLGTIEGLRKRAADDDVRSMLDDLKALLAS